MSDNPKYYLALSEQQQIFDIEKNDKKQGCYNIFRVYDINGKLNTELLTIALQNLLARHPILNAQFIPVGNHYQFVIRSTNKCNIVSQQINPEHSQAFITDEVNQPFNIEQDALYRFTIAKISENKHLLILLLHHSISDGSSITQILREIEKDYIALSQVGSVLSIESEITYCDYINEITYHKIDSQSEWLAGLSQSQIPFGKLSHNTKQLVESTSQNNFVFSFDKTMKCNLRSFAKANKTTPFLVLFSVFSLLLYRISDSDVITISTPYANRNKHQYQHALGYFVKTLLVAIEYQKKCTFKQLLTYVKQQFKLARKNKDVDLRALPNSVTHAFHVMFNYLNIGSQDLALPDVDCTRIWPQQTISKFDLLCWLWEGEEADQFVLEFDPTRFNPKDIQQLGERFKILCQEVLNDPDKILIRYSLLTQSDEMILTKFNDTEQPLVYDNIYTQFEKVAKQFPERIALCDLNNKICYAQLHNNVMALAKKIHGFRLIAQEVVAIILPRNIDMIATLLATLQCKAVFLLLDPELPAERLQHYLQVAKPSIVILDPSQTKDKQLQINSPYILDKDGAKIVVNKSSYQPQKISDKNAAYLIFTSGSTNKPKAVIGNHRNTLNRCLWMWHRYPFDSKEQCCQKTSQMFVDCLWEIFGPLLKGISNTIIDSNTVKDVEKFIATLANYNITRLVVVPSYLQALLNYLDIKPTNLYSLQWVTVSGDRLTKSLSQHFFKHFPQATLLNLYGSSEVGADVSCFSQTLTTQSTLNNVPIGLPIANTKIHIVDQHLNICPPGFQGQIAISGASLASGYLVSQENSAKGFISASPHCQGKSYLTGDIGMINYQGQLLFLGRTDHQVKIHGNKVMLQEIESYLQQNHQISDCVVVYDDKNSKLVAFICLDKASLHTTTEHEIRAYLRDRIPVYMIPNTIIFQDEIPLTIHGKINYQDLRATILQKEKTQPVNHTTLSVTQVQLLNIIREIFDNDEIHIQDNFYNIGGESLRCMQLINAIKKEFSITLDMDDIIFSNTLKDIAESIDNPSTKLDYDFPVLGKEQVQ